MAMQEYVKNLQEARARAWNEGSELVETAAAEQREMTPEEQTKWEAINADLDAKDEQIRSFQDREQRERESAEARSAYESVMSPTEIRTREVKQLDDMTRFINGDIRAINLDLKGVARERKLIRSGAGGRELRDLMEDTTTSGGYTVPTSFMRTLWDFLEFYTGARQLNIENIVTDSGEALQIPNVASHGTASLKGEGTALAENDGQFGQVTLHAWKYGVITQVTNEMITDSGIDILGFVAKDTARAIARATDTDYVTGSGSSKPKGIITTQAVGATAQTGSTGVPSYGNLVDLIYSVNPEARMAGAQWFTLDTNVAKIRKITDTQNRPLWEPSLQVGEPDNFMGYGIVQDPNVAAFATAAGTALAFGHFGSFAIRDVGSLRFERSDEYAFVNDLVTFRTVIRTDSNWLDGNNGECKFLKMPTT